MRGAIAARVALALLSIALLPAAHAAQEAGFCGTRLEPPSRLERAIESSGSDRLRRFFSAALPRYSKDPRALAISDAIASGDSFGISSLFKGMDGSVSITRKGSTLEVDLPVVQLADDSGELMELGKVSKRIDTRFVALMAGVEEGIRRRLVADPTISAVAIGSNVVNERLANLLLDLGFGNPFFGRTLTRAEVHFILTQKKFPPSLFEVAERLRAENPQWSAKPSTAELANAPLSQKDLLSIPYRLELVLPP
jgi:hypothetical protein